jgi:hypothetical protein
MTKPLDQSGSRTILARLRRALALLISPFRGAAPGATLVEYMLVTGFVALVAILGFNRFGKTLHASYEVESEHIRGEGVPRVRNLLGDLGGLPDGFCVIGEPGCKPGSGMCFGAGTPVATENGNRPIESIVTGERVWATNVETGETALKSVITTFIRRRVEVIDLEVSAGSFFGERISVTPGHEFYAGERGWLRAAELTATPLWASIPGAVATAVTDAPRLTTVYNLEVEDFHTYYVGAARALVHNQNCQGAPVVPPRQPGPLKCGEGGAYGSLPSSSTHQRDHVPSGGALKKRAQMLLFKGTSLTGSEQTALQKASPAFRRLMNAVENQGLTIAIPNKVHTDSSLTFGGRNQLPVQRADAQDLQGAAQRDIAALQAALANSPRQSDRDCLAAYTASAQQILNMTQADYDARLNALINALTPEERKEIEDALEDILG